MDADAPNSRRIRLLAAALIARHRGRRRAGDAAEREPAGHRADDDGGGQERRNDASDELHRIPPHEYDTQQCAPSSLGNPPRGRMAPCEKDA
jgi:hypothetical protein